MSFQHSDNCRSKKHSSYDDPPMAPGTAITALVDSTLTELEQNANKGCTLCFALYGGGRHFATFFNSDANLENVVVQYVTELTEARLVLRNVKALMAPIEVKIVNSRSPADIGMPPRPSRLSVARQRSAKWLMLFRPWIKDIPRNQDHRSEVNANAVHHAVSMARGWLDACRSHRHCPGAADAILPTRVLDLSTGKVRIHLTRGEKEQYMTLSHCWGSHGHITTTTQNLAAHQQEIPWSYLSRTFRDAIMVTRELGCRYLWIDSLCIVQDDQEDWERESAQMASIYKNSFLTIAASRSPDGQGGCILDSGEKQYIWTADQTDMHTTQNSTSNPKTKRIKGSSLWEPYHLGNYIAKLELSHEVLNINARRPAEDIIDLGLPLFSRAWFLQERVLSPRVLHFGPTELYWECFDGLRCECLEEDSEEDRRSFLQRSSHLGAKRCYSSLNAGISGRYGDEVLWHQLVEEYSRLKLTYEMDRLPALSGIARSQNSYLAGILPEKFPECLYWVPDIAASPDAARRPSGYRAPSFSWASFEGPINYSSAPRYQLQEGSRRVVAELLDWSSTPEGSDAYGRVTDGYMKISGYNGVARVTRVFTEGYKSVCEIQASGQCQTFMLDDQLPKSGLARISVGDEVTCLLLECGKASSGRWYQPVDTYQAAALVFRFSERVNGAFERLGLIHSERNNGGGNGLFQAAPLWFTAKSELIIV
ncbi:hypothetical protein MRS44_007030 [Fusarium solani]|uniref:Heterokaryon incompatibility protein-domain-containing protein n=1 Tax=Fusarium solani TaxID=169388 RepID=A0A9P9L4M2_FUSSL|nr:heterokaryon incompatibility protein-domain-containing protein [Fusarium solani]KAH7274710.1 heterokaryon incompatibility protein-domain-containing protein [Fusarium solani]KAJ3466372.1 hypothetical protein MRS44_007030 [Fusarium solani]